MLGATQSPTIPGQVVTWRSSVQNATVGHVIGCKGTFESVSDWPYELQLRILCYLLIDRMPDEGLEETLSTLVDNREFYSTRVKASAVLEEKNQVKVTIGETRETPPLHIDGE